MAKMGIERVVPGFGVRTGELESAEGEAETKGRNRLALITFCAVEMLRRARDV